MKKGRHRRYEEARNLKRGPDLDIEALFSDLGGQPSGVASLVGDDDQEDLDYTDEVESYYEDDDDR